MKLWKVREVPGFSSTGPDGNPLKIGDSIELNLREGAIDGFCSKCGFSREPPKEEVPAKTSPRRKSRGVEG